LSKQQENTPTVILQGEPQNFVNQNTISLFKVQLNYRKAILNINLNSQISAIYFSQNPIPLQINENNQTFINDNFCDNQEFCMSSKDTLSGIVGNYNQSINFCTNFIYFAIVSFAGVGSANNFTIQIISDECIFLKNILK